MPVPQPAASASSAPAVRAHIAAEDALYPCSDGKPMSENMWQGLAILKAAGDLEVAHPGALVAPDILVYPEQGNPRNRVAPDVLVAFGLGAHNRSTYLAWKEGKPPDWVLEVASPSTVGRDLDAKRRIYAAMGVPEYWQFDPQGGLFPLGAPRLRGLTLVDGEYEPLPARLERGARTIHSPVLGLDLRAEGALIRFRNPSTGEDVRHQGESEAAAIEQAARVRTEAARRKAAEALAEREAAARETAEALAKQEAAARETAEALAKQEAAARRAAEAHSRREAAARAVAEARVAELEAALHISRPRPSEDN